ncbi:MAG: XRE family transcriptional regulator [Acidobacteriota bacterium]|nr:XRE family transcriptional regulator [Acidobacteriota bacterium]
MPPKAPRRSKAKPPVPLDEPEGAHAPAGTLEPTPEARPQTPAEEPDHEIEAVQDEKVQQYLDQRVIGDRIRGLRLANGLGLTELGNRTGLSASFLSQLETGRVVPTLRNLARIALVFHKDLSWFFRQTERVSFRILRREDRVPLVLERKDNARFVSESLSALIPDRHLVPCLAEFHPHDAVCEFVPKIFTGQEFIYVIDGDLSITVPRESHMLGAGDIAWIDGATPRQYRCSGSVSAHTMIMTFPRQ